MDISHFHLYFCPFSPLSSFPYPRKMPSFLHKTDLEGLCFAVDLGVLQKNGCSGAFMELLSQNLRNKAERSKGS